MPLLRKEPPNGIGRLRSLREPLARLLFIDHDRPRLGPRIVDARNLDESPVARRARVGHDEAIRRLLFCADARNLVSTMLVL